MQVTQDDLLSNMQMSEMPNITGTWLAVMPRDSDYFMSETLREKIAALLEAKGINCIVFPIPVELEIVEI